MAKQGWQQLLDGAPWFERAGAYPITAYSEFMPAPRLGRKAYRHADREPQPFHDGDPFGWYVTEYEEALELTPGLHALADHLLKSLRHLGNGEPAPAIGRYKLQDNPYWPEELANAAGKLSQERYVLLLALALSRTQDDKGRIRWTLFGNSEQGPAKAFWKSFYVAPNKEGPADDGPGFIRRLLENVYGERIDERHDLHKAGFRILAQGEPLYPWWDEGPLPSWATPYLLEHEHAGKLPRSIKYLLTFRPFAQLPKGVRNSYLQGHLHLLPFPGSLLFWGTPGIRLLGGERPIEMQTVLLSLARRHEAPYGLRIPQAGWMHEHGSHNGDSSAAEHFGTFKSHYRRTHRFAAVLRDEDELAMEGCDDKLLHALFSTQSDDLGLYGKPMARNVQIWTHDFRFLLDGPYADAKAIRETLHRTREGGVFGYRFLFPAMRVGKHEVYWQRPLCAFSGATNHEAVMLEEPPLGYLTAYRLDKLAIQRPVEMWPRFLRRDLQLAALEVLNGAQAHCLHPAARNVRLLHEAFVLNGEAHLERSLARRIIKIPRDKTLESWLEELPTHATDAERGKEAANALEALLQPAHPTEELKKAPSSLTYKQTANRAFQVRYWRTIAKLAEGRFQNKNNADCVRDAATEREQTHHHRDLEALGDFLLDYYRKTIEKAGMSGKAFAGEVPFRWQTDFDFALFGGWVANQEKATHERDLLITIPGKDRSRAVIMADHYDTAYMYDVYHRKGKPRVAAEGADDNHSATTALMLGAPIFLELSAAGQLECDIWLIHLTGEEFPADCLGARQVVQQLVEGRLQQHLEDGTQHDLSQVRVQGAFVLDMVAHNNPRERDVFQISPGVGRQSLWLAEQAHAANELWNRATTIWNRTPAMKKLRRASRSRTGQVVPPPFRFLPLAGEVRLPSDPRSTLYNTDALMFSDAGVPVVLFMEDYDINRSGYHDTEDTMENIDLDYGSALTAIAIETVARTACATPP